MKKTYNIEVDCANCANLMEEATKKTAGVEDAVVNFMTQKMIVTFEEGTEPKKVMKDVLKACRKVDYILTHTAPYSLVTQLRDVEGEYPLNLFLQEIEEKIRYKHWYFGHFHRDMELDEKHTGVYHRLLPLR